MRVLLPLKEISLALEVVTENSVSVTLMSYLKSSLTVSILEWPLPIRFVTL